MAIEDDKPTTNPDAATSDTMLAFGGHKASVMSVLWVGQLIDNSTS